MGLWAWAIYVLLMVALVVSTSPGLAQTRTWPALRYVGFSSDFGPTDEQERTALRRAVCYALDKESLVKAAMAILPPAQAARVKPAVGIQNPELEGHNADVKGYPYNPEFARESLKKSGWTGEHSELIFLVGPNPPAAHRAFFNAVEESLRRTLLAGGLQSPLIGIKPVANFDSLFRDIRRDTVPAYIHRWLGLPGTPGYPSFALMIAERYKGVADLRQLFERNDSRSAEAYLLEKALVCPAIWEPQ